jgi:hypothetical protein
MRRKVEFFDTKEARRHRDDHLLHELEHSRIPLLELTKRIGTAGPTIG